jgi:hypothetical protein
MRAAALILSWLVIVTSLFALSPAISAWERRNGYPYGRMCDSIFTGFEDTCPRH